MSGPTAKTAIGWWLLCVCLILLLDAAIFRTPLYWKFIEPNSKLGSIKKTIQSIEFSETAAGVKPVVVFGNSRIAEGFSYVAANEEAVKHTGPRFASGGIPGAELKTLYYFSRFIDPSATRFSAVVIGIDEISYQPPGPWCDVELSYIHAMVTPFDLPELIEGCEWTPAIKAIVVSGGNYREDMHAFLKHPIERIRSALAWDRSGGEWLAAYRGRHRRLSGISYDPTTKALVLPADIDTDLSKLLRQIVQGMSWAPSKSPYRSLWLPRLVDRYRAAQIPVFLFQVPRSPLHGRVPINNSIPSYLADLERKGSLRILPIDLMADLEQPEMFFDAMHLNRYGREVMSRRLATHLSKISRLP